MALLKFEADETKTARCKFLAIFYICILYILWCCNVHVPQDSLGSSKMD